MKEIHTANDEISKKMRQLEQSYDSLKNSTSLILAAIPDIQTQRLIKTKILEESIGDVATTKQDRSVLGKLFLSTVLDLDLKSKRLLVQTKQQIFDFPVRRIYVSVFLCILLFMGNSHVINTFLSL